MLVKVCDICGAQGSSVNKDGSLYSKDFISLPMDFGLFSTTLDFCPLWWAKHGDAMDICMWGSYQ